MNPLSLRTLPMALALAFPLASLAQAQTPAPALRNAPQAADAASAPRAAAAKPVVKFTITAVRFTPTKAVPEAELQQVVKPWLNREIVATDLAVVAVALRRFYEERGYGLVGVGFPTQDLAQGVLQIAIVEPRIVRVTVESPDKPPISPQKITAVLERNGIAKDEPLDVLALDRAMYTLNDWPGVGAKSTLLPTGDEGRYAIAVQTEARRGWDASVDADNYGSETTGRYRAGALLRWNNPTGSGDNLDLRASVSSGKGTLVGRLGYEIPLGSTAWRLGAGISRVEYELGQDFAGAGAVGSANVADVSLSYPFIRTRDRNLVGRVALTSKKLVDEFGDTTEKKVRGGEFGLSFENRDAFAGGGFTGGNLSLQFGKLDIESEVYRNYDATLGDRATQGSFRKLGVQVNRLQAVVPRVSLFVGLVGQFASKNLDNAEKMTLGGARGVRAYPSAEGSSDEAAVLNTELRLWVDPQWTGFLFYDAGHGKRFKRPDDDGRPNTLNLHGSGLGVQYTNPEFFTLKAAVARRGDEPVTSEADDKRTRFLVELQHAF
jgi:hemolysin activation/secretion protein